MKHLICQEFSHKKQIYIFSLLYVKVIAWTCGKDERSFLSKGKVKRKILPFFDL